MFAILARVLFFAAVCRLASGTDLSREIVLAPHAGTAVEDREIVRWQRSAEKTGARAEVFEQLGWAYVAKARRTHDAGYYKLAEKTADVMDAQFGPSAESRLLRGHVLHNLHRFRAAEEIARRLVAERAGPADLALLSDALMERGRLAEAIDPLQRMVNAKPGAEAYSRIAHLRWLKGDLAGAIAIMESAVRAAGSRHGETRAWLLVRVSGFRLQAGELELARAAAEEAATAAADYAPAMLACGRTLLALGRTEEAIVALGRAAELNPMPEYQWWLADALRVARRTEAAEEVEARLRAHGESADPRVLALFLATRGEQVATAERLARRDLEERTDVFALDALAWALAAQGKHVDAEPLMRAALAEGTRDARLFLHAGEIAYAQGELEAAAKFFEHARAGQATLTSSERALLARRSAEGGGRTAR